MGDDRQTAPSTLMETTRGRCDPKAVQMGGRGPAIMSQTLPAQQPSPPPPWRPDLQLVAAARTPPRCQEEPGVQISTCLTD